MNFVLKPSLEHRALVKIAVSLWNQNDFGALISLVYNKYRVFPLNEKWMEIEARVLERVPQLSLPQILNEKVFCFVQTVGLEIYEWMEFHCRRFDLPFSLPLELCWTPEGTVDRKRTAERLVKDESLDVGTRYVLACIYCFEDDIIALWNTLSEDLREYFLLENPSTIRELYEKWIISFWSVIMERMLGHASTSYKRGFEECAYRGHKVALEYFLQKLTLQEREESLIKTTKRVSHSDTLRLLLSEIDEQQQMEYFKDNPHKVLYCFLKWPFQSLFIEIANCVCDFLSKEHYEGILRYIIDKVRDGYKDCNYRKLFGEFWQKSPHALKSFITNKLDKSWMLPSLFVIKDKEIFRFILQDAAPAAREKLIYSDKMYDLCRCSFRDEEWEYLEFCIRECFPSKDLMLKFKQELEKREKWGQEEDIFVGKKHKWDKLFLSSDDSIREYAKGSADEGESSSSKRFQSLQ